MDPLDAYRDLIEKILTEYSRLKYAYGDVQKLTALPSTLPNTQLSSRGGWVY